MYKCNNRLLRYQTISVKIMKVGLSFIIISELRVRVKITSHDHISQKNIEGSRTK